MNSKCNRCGRPGGRNSSYVRQCDLKKIVQYRCFRCKCVWTVGTDNFEKGQKLRSVNETLSTMLSSSVSMRRCAFALQINRKTVARKAKYLAKKAAHELRMDLQQKTSFSTEELFLDELITFEHTRCKPLAVSMIVNRKRQILAFSVSSMPVIGRHLKRVSLRKYGKRRNDRTKGVLSCLRSVEGLVTPQTLFYSDEEPSYRRAIQKVFPGQIHKSYPSKRAVIAGQGELKDHSFDPIFPINHTFAMLRANLARLVRRTWSTTKKAESLADFLHIYTHFHNHVLLAQAS